MADLDRTRVREALELLDYSISSAVAYEGSERDRRLDILVQYFLKEFPPDPNDLGITADFLDKRIRSALKEANEDSSPVDSFIERFEELPAEIGSIPQKSYEIGFPLNLSNWPLGDEITFQDQIFKNIDRGTWEEKYEDPAHNDTEFANEFKEVPNQFDEEFTYWEFEYTARDPEYAIEITERGLEVVLGQIIYSMFPWSHSNQFSQGNVWNRPWSELRSPFVYLVRDEEGYRDYYFDDDISPRKTIQVLRDKEEWLKHRYNQMPPLGSPNKIEQKIISAFRNFQSGATEPDRRRAFLDYWRAIETLCLFGDENMQEVARRIKSIVPNEAGDELFEERIDEITDKRNKFVHEQVDVEVADRDNEFLRSIFYQLIRFMIINRKSEVDRVKIWLKNGNKPTPQLEHDLHNKEREVSTLQEIIGSRKT